MPWVFLYDLHLIAWRLGVSLNLELCQLSAGPYDLSIPPCPYLWGSRCACRHPSFYMVARDLNTSLHHYHECFYPLTLSSTLQSCSKSISALVSYPGITKHIPSCMLKVNFCFGELCLVSLNTYLLVCCRSTHSGKLKR